MNLFELSSDFLALADRLTADEVDESALAAIGANEDSLRAKAGGYLAVSRTLRAEAETMRAEARRLAELARRREAGADRLEARLVYCLDLCRIDRLPTPLGAIRVQAAGRPAIAWPGGVESIPAGFTKVKTEYRLDADKALAAWKAGSLPAGFQVTTTRSLRVG